MSQRTSTLSYEDQINRIDQIINSVYKLNNVSEEVLNKNPDAKTWSVLQVVNHIDIANRLYEEKIKKVLGKLPKTSNGHVLSYSSAMNRWIVKSMRPIQNKRKWKMKTLKKFKPGQSSSLDKSVIQSFIENLQHLKAFVEEARHKQTKGARISSAIGPIVKFEPPECFEFIINHTERHMVQIEHILSRLKK